MSNRTALLDSFRKRWETVAQTLQFAKDEAKEDFADLLAEMKGHEQGLSKHEIAGIKLAAKRALESDEKREKRTAVESIADALGDFASSPLGMAAVEAGK